MSRAIRAVSFAFIVSLPGCSEDTHGTGPSGSGGKPAAGASGGAVAPGGSGASSGGAGSGGRAGSDGGVPGSGGTSGSGAGGGGGESGASSGGSGNGGTPDAGRADADAATTACGARVDGIEVSTVDLDAFPPYAIDGCVLVYVSPSGELVRRDLASGKETTLAAATEKPRRPALSGPVTAWEATENGNGVVRVRVGDTTTTIAGSFDHAGEPRATLDAVVFTGWLSAAADGDTDVFVWKTSASAPELVLGGAGQQRFADISPTHVAVSDFSEDPGGHYTGDGTSLADVVLVDRTTGKQIRRQLAGKQAFPMLGSEGSLAYLEWLDVHPVPKLQDYTIRAVPLATPTAPATEVAHVMSYESVRPTVAAGHAEWVSRDSAGNSLYQADFAGSGPVQVPLQGISTVHAPISTARLTILAVRPMIDSVPRLDVVAW